MNDLSELLKECAPVTDAKRPSYEALAKARELKDLGFDYLAAELRDKVLLAEKMECVKKEGYLVITNLKIQAFLKRKADEYNEAVVKKHGPRREQTLGSLQGLIGRWSGSANQTSTWTSPGIGITSDLVAFTNDFLSPSEERVSGFMWTEEKVSEYKAVPPDAALAALKTAKGKEIFDYFVIASVTNMKDPLLLGRLHGSEDRYFLAQWGEDIALDDVI